jgi:hypothetical protein
VSDRLREEIRAFVAERHDGIEVAVLPLRERFLGVQLGASAKYPRYRTRLFRRDRYRHDEARTVHEGLWPLGPTWAFAGDLDHMLAGTWREALRDGWTYSRLEAEQSVTPRGPLGYARRIGVRPLVKLAYRIAIDGGWRDGPAGLAKIALDCGVDATVGVRQLCRRPRGIDAGDHRPGAGGGHYARSLQVGSVRVLALALGQGAAAEAEEWLARARTAGADVGLVSDARADANLPLHVRALAGGGPLSLIRALDAEDQLRPVDGLIALGPRARGLTRLMPRRALRAGTLIDAGQDPAEAVQALRARTRA